MKGILESNPTMSKYQFHVTCFLKFFPQLLKTQALDMLKLTQKLIMLMILSSEEVRGLILFIALKYGSYTNYVPK